MDTALNENNNCCLEDDVLTDSFGEIIVNMCLTCDECEKMTSPFIPLGLELSDDWYGKSPISRERKICMICRLGLRRSLNLLPIGDDDKVPPGPIKPLVAYDSTFGIVRPVPMKRKLNYLKCNKPENGQLKTNNYY